jgi:TRAP-type mannitol/chloroaromatic compound transport system substrate-binding protein
MKANDLRTARILFRAIQAVSMREDVLNDHPKASNEVNAETSASNPDFKKIYDSQMAFRDDGNLWWQVAEYSYETFMIRTRPRG